MQIYRLTSLILTAILILLMFLMAGCRLFGSPVVETIVKNPSNWALSPEGDKLVYDYRDTVLLFLPSTQQYKIDSCSGFNWLDNTKLFCKVGGGKPSIVFTDDMLSTGGFFRVPLEDVNVEEIDLEAVLSESGTIYRFDERVSNSLLVLDTDYKSSVAKNYFVTGIENIDAVLQDYPYITIPPRHPSLDSEQKVFSPNGDYYYRLEGLSRKQRLTIYNTTDNSKLTEFQLPADSVEYIELGGWATDSSGVYFRLQRAGPASQLTPGEIKKLKMPQ